MPRFTVWLSEADYQLLLASYPVPDKNVDQVITIMNDLAEQVVGIPEGTDGSED